MRFECHFLISPKNELVSRLECVESQFLKLLLEPVLWAGEKYDGGPMFSDLELLIKILFLDGLKREYECDPAYPDVFNGLTTSVDFFDTLWSIKMIDSDESINSALDAAIHASTIDDLGVPGNEEVNSYIHYYRRAYRDSLKSGKT